MNGQNQPHSRTTPDAGPDHDAKGSDSKRPKRDRKDVVDRRLFINRREMHVEGEVLGPDGKPLLEEKSAGPEGSACRRRGPGRRLSDFTKRAEEGEMNREQFLFLMAIDEFKKANSKHYPSWTDVLEVIRLLGYRKTVASELKLSSAEDWTELADAPANVRPDNWQARPEAA